MESALTRGPPHPPFLNTQVFLKHLFYYFSQNYSYRIPIKIPAYKIYNSIDKNQNLKIVSIRIKIIENTSEMRVLLLEFLFLFFRGFQRLLRKKRDKSLTFAFLIQNLT